MQAQKYIGYLLWFIIIGLAEIQNVIILNIFMAKKLCYILYINTYVHVYFT